jgi:hypothetical protein
VGRRRNPTIMAEHDPPEEQICELYEVGECQLANMVEAKEQIENRDA